MSYLVLARKYRPRTFSEVVGQETPMRTLQGAIADGRVGHAYLFCGPRGTGKTTTARILAKALLCDRGPTGEPCLACDHCRDIESGNDVDVLEFDAASNTGVDDVRSLKETVAFAPMRARFKIYIIDEVHMMSKAAFNALLKTLEEPPAHVKFLFATTEPEKVIETVRSRCQLVRLSLIPEARIAEHLEVVLAREGITPEPGVTAELARFARGSLRDGLSITDQLIALVGAQPTVADVARVAPQGGAEQVEDLLDLLERGQRAELLSALPKTEGGEPELCGGMLQRLRIGLLSLLCPAEAQLFEGDSELRQRSAARAKRLGPERVQLWLEELLHARERMELLPSQARVVLEVTLLDLCRGELTMPLAVLEERLMALEARLAQGGPPRPNPAPAPSSAAPAQPPRVAPPPPSAPSTEAKPAPTRQERASAPNVPPPPEQDKIVVPARPPAPARPAAPAPAPRANKGGLAWAPLLAEIASSNPELATALERRCQIVDTHNQTVTVRITRPSEAERALLVDPNSVACVEASMSRLSGRTIKLVLDDPATRAGGAHDPFTRGVAELFSGQIED